MSDRIAIEYDGVKRYLERPYAICLDRSNLHALYNALKEIVDREESEDRYQWTYGWINVPLNVKGVPNTSPLNWKDGA